MHQRIAYGCGCRFVPDACAGEVKDDGAGMVVEVEGVGEGFCGGKEELAAYGVDEFLVFFFCLDAEAGHLVGEEDGGEGEAEDDAIGEVVGGNNDGDDEDDDEGVALWHFMESSEGVPVEGGDGNGDHDGGKGGEGDLDHEVVQKEDEDHEEAAADEVGESASAAGVDVDDGLADHGAAAGAAEKSADDVGDAEAAAFSVAVAFCLCHVVDDFTREEGLGEAYDGEGDGIWQDDHEGFHIEGNVWDVEGWQSGGDGAHVTDGADVNVADDGDGGDDDDGDEGGWDGGGEVWEEIDDGDAEGDEGEHGEAFSFKVAELGGEDEDGKSIHKADLDGVWDEFDKVADLQGAKDEHDDAAEDGGGHEVFRAMVTDEADDDEGHGACCCRDHGWSTAEEGHEDGEPEGGIEAHHWADAGDDAEADDFRDDGEGGNEAGKHIAANVAEPLLFFLCEVH